MRQSCYDLREMPSMNSIKAFLVELEGKCTIDI